MTSMMLDEAAYRRLVDETLHRIDEAFEDVDPDLAESTIAQGALTIAFPNGLRAIVSPQPPVRQMWLAFRDRGYHFDWDAARERWMDDRGQGLELLELVSKLTRETSGVTLGLATSTPA
jgi:iron-sulfur cluster assembly protein CyaY